VKTDTSRILLVHGHETPRQDIRAILGQRYAFTECMLADLPSFRWTTALELVIDAPLETEIDVQRAIHGFSTLPKTGQGIVFVMDQLARQLMVRAHALGAEAIIPRPLQESTVFSVIDSLLVRARKETWTTRFGAEAGGLVAGTDALEHLFQFAVAGTKLTQFELYDRGDTVIDTLADTGLGRWVEAVKAHHSQTFRHSLLVTGVAVGFGQHLGMRRDDLRRLAVSGLVHDIGKAAIPLNLLEKPGALTKEETTIVREHTTLGRDILLRQGGFSPEMIDVVTHHHEMLDGSGYPDGLAGEAIKDLVRLVTISDIFAALIEQRAYKLPMPNEVAYAHLATMHGKLDMSLVDAFRPIAMETRLAA
jgi:putative nucleotidyltransferase with HDIG domain